jgi:ribosome-interacting GTPase 1
MPANLTPAYKAAEKAYRRAREPAEQLECLREMLREIPKHKGTDHLQADIKTRIKEVTQELSAPRKTGGGGPQTVFRPEGAGQIALVGPPNTGKSTLHDRLTGSHAATGPYPFTTQFPQPGMMPVEDIAFQLIDLPAVSSEHPVPWLANALQPADACLLVVDVTRPDCIEQVAAVPSLLGERQVTLTRCWPVDTGNGDDLEDHDPFSVTLPTLLVATKGDLMDDAEGEVATFRDLAGLDLPTLIVSATTGDGLASLGEWLFRHLGVVRVYTKIPGRPADMGRPFCLRTGETVLDVARLVHKEVAASFRYARLWGGGDFDGQQVGAEHVVADGDVLEMHT